MEQPINLNTATFIGIDSHPSEHTAVAINRFEDEKGVLRFENTKKGIKECIAWLAKLATDTQQIIIGIEGGETLASYLLDHYPHVYEVNPMFTSEECSVHDTQNLILLMPSSLLKYSPGNSRNCPSSMSGSSPLNAFVCEKLFNAMRISPSMARG